MVVVSFYFAGEVAGRWQRHRQIGHRSSLHVSQKKGKAGGPCEPPAVKIISD
jgi:hypothetical protein